jgi:hypothetical protein
MPAPPAQTNTDTRPSKTNQHYAEALLGTVLVVVGGAISVASVFV